MAALGRLIKKLSVLQETNTELEEDITELDVNVQEQEQKLLAWRAELGGKKLRLNEVKQEAIKLARIFSGDEVAQPQTAPQGDRGEVARAKTPAPDLSAVESAGSSFPETVTFDDAIAIISKGRSCGDDAEAVTGAKLPPSIHERFPTVMFIGGLWTEISCNWCGANAARSTGKFLKGVSGLLYHACQAHSLEFGERRKYDAVMASCTKRAVSATDVARMKRGEDPVDSRILIMYAPEPVTASRKGHVSASADATTGVRPGTDTQSDVHENCESTAAGPLRHTSKQASADCAAPTALPTAAADSPVIHVRKRQHSPSEGGNTSFGGQKGINLEPPYGITVKRRRSEYERIIGFLHGEENDDNEGLRP